MKKSILLIIVLILVIASLLLWASTTELHFNLQGVFIIIVLLLIVLFAAYQIISRIKSLNRDELPEDELSKKVLRRASSMSFYTSIYFWLLFSFLNDSWELEGHTIIGAGILMMVIIFIIFWIYFKIKGIKDE